MHICLDGRICILWAVLVLTVPLPWLLSAILAAIFHELCHLTALVLTGIPIFGVHIGLRGMSIQTGPMEPGLELLSAAAGPAGSLLLLLFLRQIPRIALCGTIQGIYNLLPVYPLDGGRILRSIFTLLTSTHRKEKYLAKKQISLYNSATKDK